MVGFSSTTTSAERVILLVVADIHEVQQANTQKISSVGKLFGKLNALLGRGRISTGVFMQLVNT